MDNTQATRTINRAALLADHVEDMIYSEDEDDTYGWQANVIICALGSIALSLTVLARSAVAEKLEGDNG